MPSLNRPSPETISEATAASDGASAVTPPPAIEAGRLTLCQFYDVGFSIDLDRAQNLLAQRSASRHAPAQARQSGSIQIAQPPLRVDLGEQTAALGSLTGRGSLRAGIYDLGVVVLTLDLDLPPNTSWSTVGQILNAWQEPPPSLRELFSQAVDGLTTEINPAITRPERSSIIEDYSILTVNRLVEATPADIAGHPLVLAALLGEQRALSPTATRLIASLSYFPEDLALLSWNGALLIEPDPAAAQTAQELIEFANVELLLMRSYDADIDAELPRVYRRIEGASSRFHLPFVRRYSLLMHDVQRLVIEVTEVTERVDNALKVTDDVYWNRLYSALLTVLRVQMWRQGVEHKLVLLRETYGMLHDESDAERATTLEVTVIILIAVEIVMALLRAH
ncbi:MAG: hypothetical protein U0822_10885 [Anaerolineae bacterium]